MKSRIRLLLTAIVLVGLAHIAVLACEIPPLSTRLLDSWRPGPRVVQLSIDSGYSSVQREQLARGVFNWNIWGLVDCSFVEFVGGTSTPLGRKCMGKTTALLLDMSTSCARPATFVPSEVAN